MNLLDSDRSFAVTKKLTGPIGSASVLYRVVERDAGKLVRTFAVRITQTQAARPQLREDIVRWCEILSEKLPQDGGEIPIDLDNVRRL